MGCVVGTWERILPLFALTLMLNRTLTAERARKTLRKPLVISNLGVVITVCALHVEPVARLLRLNRIPLISTH